MKKLQSLIILFLIACQDPTSKILQQYDNFIKDLEITQIQKKEIIIILYVE